MRTDAITAFPNTFGVTHYPNQPARQIRWGNGTHPLEGCDTFHRTRPITRKRSGRLPLWGFLFAGLLGPTLSDMPVAHTVAAKTSTSAPTLNPIQQAQLNTFNQQLQHASIQYFIDQRHLASGLILDRAFATKQDTPHPKARMASIAATGYGLSAWVLGASSGQIPVNDAKAWTQQVLDTVEKSTLPEQKGWLAHFIDVDTLQPYGSSEISSVDTALFYLGALTAGQYFGGEIQQQVQRMFDQIDFPFMLTQNGRFPDSQTFSHGFYLEGTDHPIPRFIPHQWDHYAEGVVLPLLALGSTTHPVSVDVWNKGWKREPPWQYKDHTTLGPLPLFIYYYPLGYLNLQNKADTQGFNPWEIAKQAVLAQIAYCQDNGYPDKLFGLSACDGPTGYHAYQPEDKPGSKTDKTIALPAMAAALPWAPDAVLHGLTVAKNKGWIDSRYGLACAVDPTTGWKSSDALGIDIGSTLLMLDAGLNQRIYRQTDQHPVLQRGLKRAGFTASR